MSHQLLDVEHLGFVENREMDCLVGGVTEVAQDGQRGPKIPGHWLPHPELEKPHPELVSIGCAFDQAQI